MLFKNIKSKQNMIVMVYVMLGLSFQFLKQEHIQRWFLSKAMNALLE